MTIKEVYNIVMYISIFSVTLPVIYYLINMRDYPRHLHLIGLLVCASALSDVTAHYFGHVKMFHTIPVVHNTWVIVQFCLLSFFYYEVFLKKRNPTYVKTILIHSLLSALLFYLFAKHPYFISKNFMSYHSLGRVLASITFITYAVTYYRTYFTTAARSSLSSTATLWINGGVLFYFGVAIWPFLLRDQSISNLSLDAVTLVWIIHNLANTLKNLLFAKGLYEARKVIRKAPDSRLIVPQQG